MKTDCDECEKEDIECINYDSCDLCIDCVDRRIERLKTIRKKFPKDNKQIANPLEVNEKCKVCGKYPSYNHIICMGCLKVLHKKKHDGTITEEEKEYL